MDNKNEKEESKKKPEMIRLKRYEREKETWTEAFGSKEMEEKLERE